MKTQEFIDKKISQGYQMNVYPKTSQTIYLRKGLSCFAIYEDGEVGYSDPSGGARYTSIENYLANNPIKTYKNGPLD